MDLHRLDLVSLPLFDLVVRTGTPSVSLKQKRITVAKLTGFVCSVAAANV